ncbi:MAG: IS607 family transposase [Candidatus Methanodesulfokora sp.]
MGCLQPSCTQSTSTVRCWIRSGYIKAVRTRGGHYRIPKSEVERILSKKGKQRAVIYARACFRGLRDEIDRQVCFLKNYCEKKGYKVVKVIEEVSSSLDDDRRGISELIEMVLNGMVDVVVVAYRDRLFRFHFKLIERLLKGYGVKIDVAKGDMPPWEKEELLEDLIKILKEFSPKICPECKLDSLEEMIRSSLIRS